MFKNKVNITTLEQIDIAKLCQHISPRPKKLSNTELFFDYIEDLDWECFLFINVEENK